jgi:hypothetical protein
MSKSSTITAHCPACAYPLPPWPRHAVPAAALVLAAWCPQKYRKEI